MLGSMANHCDTCSYWSLVYYFLVTSVCPRWHSVGGCVDVPQIECLWTILFYANMVKLNEASLFPNAHGIVFHEPVHLMAKP